MILVTRLVGAATLEEMALVVLDRGIALYEQGDLPAARAAFVEARDLVPEKPNPHRWLGLAEARLHHCHEAILELELFLLRAPADDPRRAEAAAVRDRCRGELAPQLGRLTVESQPPGAEVRVDDPAAAVAGLTPRELSLVEGRHVLYVSKPGFSLHSVEVQVAPGAAARVQVPLEALAGAPPAAVPRRRSRAWIAGVVVAGVVVAGAALGLGLGLGLSQEPAPTPISAINGSPHP